MQKTVAVKLGGSLLSRSEVNPFDFAYLAKLREIVTLPELDETKFFFAIGGGYTMRQYRDLAKAAGVQKDMELHWIGTTVNVLHAYMVKAFFEDIAEDEVMKYEDYYEDRDFRINRKMMVGGGGRPGHSGDMDALLAAKKLTADTVISLKNIDGIYDSDPSKNPQARKIDELSWDEYLDIIGWKNEHEPGGNYPIDPVTSKMAKENAIRFIVILGDDLESFRNFLLGRDFTGSIVS